MNNKEISFKEQQMNKRAIGLITILLVLVVLIVAGVVIYLVKNKQISGPTANERQAVFLTNGQVYFGNLTQQDNDYIKLTGVYYLAQNQQLQPGTNAQTVNIIKLGSELQGPEDVMYISRNQVLFYENMQNSSKVNEAIQKFISSGGKN